jgi:diguanylate cyclase (GGDEF)-like protein
MSGFSPLRSVEDPRMPYRIMTAILLVAAAIALLFAVVPGTDDSIRGFDAIAGIVLALAGGFVWFVADQLSNGLGLDLAVVLGTLVASVGAALVPTASGQVLIGLGFVLFGVFIAYFRPTSRVVMHLALMFVAYSTALLVNRQLQTVVDLIIVSLVVGSVTLMVSRLANALRALALRDGLTGALNRRGLDLVSEPLSAAAARSGQPVTVGLLDIDSFKAYNDTYGHQAGDAALVAVVDAWRTQLRASDILARYGGDEFALVLPGTRREDAEELAARLAAAHELRWTAGFVEWTPQEDLYAALGRADTLMFDRKPKRG